MCSCWPAAGLPTPLWFPYTYEKSGTWLPKLPPSLEEKMRLPFSKSDLIQSMFSEGLKAHEMTKLSHSELVAGCWMHPPVLKNHIFTATLLLLCKHKCSSDYKLWTVSIVQASICFLSEGKQQNSGTAVLVGCQYFKTVTKATQMITVAHFKADNQVCQIQKSQIHQHYRC